MNVKKQSIMMRLAQHFNRFQSAAGLSDYAAKFNVVISICLDWEYQPTHPTSTF